MNFQEQPKQNPSHAYAESMAYLNQMMVMGRNDHERSSAASMLAKMASGELSPEQVALQMHAMKERKQDYN